MTSNPIVRSTRPGPARLALVAALVLGVPAAVAAQDAPVTMTIDQAIDLALQNSPTYRQTANDEAVADWNVRAAYGNFLPSLSVSSGLSYDASGTPRIGIFSSTELGVSRTPAYYSSRYGVNLSMSLSGETLFQAAEAKASQSATEKQIIAARYQLRTDVTRQYLAVLRARDAAEIAKSALGSADEAFKLAQARAQAGDATRIDVGKAEVDRGRAEVDLLQAENQVRMERIRLLQTIGIEVDHDIELVSTFEVFEPKYDLEQLQAIAGTSNPTLAAARASESAANAASRAAKTAYLPSLRLSGGWSGFVRRTGSNQYAIDNALASAHDKADNKIDACEYNNMLSARLTSPLPGYPVADCAAEYTLTAADEADIRDAAFASNTRFPFNYDPNPFSASLSISLPIVDGFTRERNVQQARAAAQDARYRRRAEELNRRAEVTTNLFALETAYRTVQLEEKNAATAAEQLDLAQQQYRLGAGSILELTQAQEVKVRADLARLTAVYTFHESLAALEAAVGVPLRDVTNAAGELEAPSPREE